MTPVEEDVREVLVTMRAIGAFAALPWWLPEAVAVLVLGGLAATALVFLRKVDLLALFERYQASLAKAPPADPTAPGSGLGAAPPIVLKQATPDFTGGQP